MGRKTKQNRICTPELIAQINPKNIRLMNDFLEYLRSTPYSLVPPQRYHFMTLIMVKESQGPRGKALAARGP